MQHAVTTIRCLAIALLVSLIPRSECLSQDRWNVLYSNDEATLKLDTTTIDRRKDGHFAAWLREEYAQPQSLKSYPGKQFVRKLTRVIYDCVGMRFKPTAGAMYDRSGDIVVQFDEPEDSVSWITPMPESLGETYISLCTSKRALLDGRVVLTVEQWSDSVAVLNRILKQRCNAATGNTKAICERFHRLSERLGHRSDTEMASMVSAGDSLSARFSLPYPAYPGKLP